MLHINQYNELVELIRVLNQTEAGRMIKVLKFKSEIHGFTQPSATRTYSTRTKQPKQLALI